jgi:sugar-specific transcriptional regulator TrmB
MFLFDIILNMLRGVKPSSILDDVYPGVDLVYIRSELQKFGLSIKQAEIYILLVAHRELRIPEIIRLAGLSRSSVYMHLDRLYEYGLAEEIIESSYRIIRPYSVSVMRHDLDKQIVTLKKLSNDLDTLEKSMAFAEPELPIQSCKVRYYKDRSGARQLFWNTLKSDSEVLAFSEWGRDRFVGTNFYHSFVAESKQRQIEERSLINFKPETLEFIRKYNKPGLNISRAKPSNIRVVDKNILPIKGESFIYGDTFAQVYISGIKIYGFEVENANFANTQKKVFEAFWNLGQPAADFF